MADIKMGLPSKATLSQTNASPRNSFAKPRNKKLNWAWDKDKGDEDIEGFKKMRRGGFWQAPHPEIGEGQYTRAELLEQYRANVARLERKRYFSQLHVELSAKYTKWATRWGVFVICLAIYLLLDDVLEIHKWRSLHQELPSMLRVANCFHAELDLTQFYEILLLLEFLTLLGVIWGFYRNPFQVFYFGWLMVRFIRYMFSFLEIARPILWGEKYRDITMGEWATHFIIPVAFVFAEMWLLIPGFLIYMYSRLGIPLYRKQRIAVQHTIVEYRKHLFFQARSLFIRKKERIRIWTAESQSALLKNLARLCDSKVPRREYFRLKQDEMEKELEETFAKLWDKGTFYLKESQPQPWKMKYREIKKWERRLKSFERYEREVTRRRILWREKLARYGVNANRFKDPYRQDLYEIAFHKEFEEFLFRKSRGEFNEIERHVLDNFKFNDDEDSDSPVGELGSDWEFKLGEVTKTPSQ